jgi:hypothetical protein
MREPKTALVPAAEQFSSTPCPTKFWTASRSPCSRSTRRRPGSLRAQIAEVLAKEAPIAFDLLARRVAAAWGIARLGERVRERVRALLPRGVVEQAGTLWAPGQDPAAFAAFRTSPAGEAARDAEDLPVVEVGNAMRWLLQQHGSLGEDDLLRETAKLFGITRLGSAVRAAMAAGLDVLVARGAAVREGEAVRSG